MRLAAAVYDVLGPTLEEIQKDMRNMKNDIVIIKRDLTSLTGRLDNLTEEIALQTDHESKLTSFNDSINKSFHSLVEIVTSEVALMNNSIRDDLNCLKTELSRVNEVVSDLGGHLHLHSQQTAVAADQLDIILSYLNVSMKDDFSGIERELSDLSNTANIIHEKIEENNIQITTELTEMNQTLTKEIINNRESIYDTAELKCGGTWGWRRAVYLDMTDPNNICPSGWQLTGYSKRTCGRVTNGWRTCDSVFFPVSGGSYTHVCGRIRAYQYGLPDGFYGYSHNEQTTIDSAYVSGVSLIHGSPRQHIWTFANGARENNPSTNSNNCPCDPSGRTSIPPFVGEDYFCESGFVYPGYFRRELAYILHYNDTLWDGRDCHSTSTCCSLHNPPFFTKTLSQTTTDDLELRICLNDYSNSDNIAVELVELYVK